MNKLKKLFLIIVLAIVPFVAINVSASTALDNLKKTALGASFSSSQTNENTVADVVGRVASIVLAFVGVVFFCFILYSGYQWLTAGGKEEAINEARTRIVQSTIGLAITAMAYFLTWFFSTVIIGQ